MIHVTKSDLLAAVEPCAKTAKGQAEIMKCVHLLGGDEGLTATGSDGNVWVTRPINTILTDEINLCVNAQKLMGAINGATDGDLSLSWEAKALTIKGDRSKSSLPFMDGIDYPIIVKQGEPVTITLTGAGVKKAASVAGACDDGPHKPVLNGVHFRPDPLGVCMSATMTHIILRDFTDGEITEPCVIHRNVIKAIEALGFSDAEEVTINVYANCVSCERMGAHCLCAAILGAFPDDGVRKSFEGERVAKWSLERDALVKALRGVAFAGESSKRTYIKQEGDSLHVYATDGPQMASLSVDVVSDVPDGFEMVVNAGLLTTVLEACEGPGVSFFFKQAHIDNPALTQSVVIRDADPTNWLAWIAPMSLR